jgi:hypothetical protein
LKVEKVQVQDIPSPVHEEIREKEMERDISLIDFSDDDNSTPSEANTFAENFLEQSTGLLLDLSTISTNTSWEDWPVNNNSINFPPISLTDDPFSTTVTTNTPAANLVFGNQDNPNLMDL